MRVFVDTSAFVALIDRDDSNHRRAAKVFEKLRRNDDSLVCSNYILVETSALLQHRLGIETLRAFHQDLFPLLSVQWIDSDCHLAAMSSVLTAGRRRLSLADCSSFELMRRAGISHVFTFDRHFKQQGFSCMP